MAVHGLLPSKLTGMPFFVLFCFVLFCFVLFCFVLFCFVLFCFVLFCFVLFCFVLFYIYFRFSSVCFYKYLTFLVGLFREARGQIPEV